MVLYPDAAKLIRSRLNGSVSIEKQNTLKVDPIIPAKLSLEIDGIGGLMPGHIIHTHYIQEKYKVEFFKSQKALGPYTYFQIVGLTQRVSPESWTTELDTIMKINHIPDRDDLRLDKEPEVEQAPQYPRMPVPNDVDYDELMIDDAVLEELDFDDFEKWEVPPPPEPVTTTETSGDGIGHGWPVVKPKVQRVERVVARYHPSAPKEFGEVTTGFAEIPEPSRPYIPVPTEIDYDELMLGDAVLEKLEFEEFVDWESPPIPFVGPMLPEEVVANNQKVVEEKDAKSTKMKKREEQRSTYRGHYWQNDKYLYSNEYYGRPDWRPIFEFKDGFRASFDRFQFDHPTRPSEAAVKTIKEDQLYSVRKEYWDREIEGPNARGKSILNKSGGDRKAGRILGARYR